MITIATSAKKVEISSIVSANPRMKSSKWFLNIPLVPAVIEEALKSLSQLHFVHPGLGGHQRIPLTLGALGGRIITPKALMVEKSST